MMEWWVHFRPEGGAIVGWENTDAPLRRDGFDVVKSSASAPPDPKRQKVDVPTRAVVDMTPAEIERAALPTAMDLKYAVVAELCESDLHANITDFPVSADRRAAWLRYRQALRDLSKPQDAQERRLTPSEVVAAWPLRPDGSDAIPQLRARIK